MAAARQSQRLRRASRGRGEAEEDTGRREDDDARGEDNAQGEEGNLPFEDSGGGVFSTLKDTAADAALAVLKPVAKRGATKAAQFAVEKGPELFEDKVLPLMEESGGPMGLMSKVAGGDGAMGGLLSKLTGGGDDDEDGDRDAGDGTGQGRRMPIQQAVDVAAPIDIVYDQFTQFEDWPKFMHRLESAEQKDEATVVFNEKIWIIRRSWEAEIVEQRPDERIVWESVSGMQHVGVVTFHELAERLTRVEVNIDIDPSGPMEKIARGARFAKRAVRADLHRFKAFVEMHEDETGAWRGEIEDGEVVGYDDDEEYEDEGYEDEEPRAEDESDEPEAEEEPEEPEAEYEDEEDEDAQAEDEDEDEEEQPRTRTRRRSSTRSSSNGSSKSESAKPKRSRAKASSSGSSSSSSRSRGGSKSGSGSKTSKAKSSNSKSSASKSSSSGSRSRSGSSSSKAKSSSRSSGSNSRSRSRGSSTKSKGRSSGGKSRAKAASSKS
jgi:uncharacterized membrane protein